MKNNNNSKKLQRTQKFLEKLTPGRRLKLLKIRKKILLGKYKYKTKLFEVFDEIISEASEEPDTFDN